MKGGRSFLDLEARVEEEIETDEDEEADMEDGFIDNSGNEESEGGHQPQHQDVQDMYDTWYDELLASAYNRAEASAGPNYRNYASQTEAIIGHPGEDDYPLWRVECRIGYEEYILAYLLEAAQPYHELRSVSMRGSIRGCVYLECQMTRDLIDLLKKTPGIKQTHQGLRSRQIDNTDYVSLFTMIDSGTDFAVGNWVIVKKGLYKGDIGLISGVKTWGVEVLLVPRFAYRLLDKKQKRKATTIRPAAELFDAAKVEGPLSHKLVHRSDVQLPFHRPTSHSYAMDTIPLFWVKQAPIITILSSGKQGVIISAEASYAEVELPSEGTHRLPWYDIQKHLVEGDYVRIISGCQQGKEGWVTEVADATATVLIESMEDKINSDMLHVEVHVNCVVVMEPPHLLVLRPSIQTTPPEKHTRHPWCDTSIIITKLGHGRKGQSGQIKDVLLNQQTSSGIMVVVQLSQFDPVTPFPTITIDHDHVAELKTQKSLLEFFEPKGNSDNDKQKYISTTHKSTTIIDDGGSATPMPIASSSTPAWDPSSQTPLSVSSPESPPQLNANTNGGKYKNQVIPAIISIVDGHLAMRHIIRNTSYALEPDWIKPKHPSPTHDNGLVLVIKGEHHGKYLRRLHHDGYGHTALMIAAVVERIEGSVDRKGYAPAKSDISG
ncbi:hypothetical protein BJ912DRAFT_933537 [Pholiota molesta]|nr:hypothetical protein BJ912DRAFT_933537 [Pholiota molesta]